MEADISYQELARMLCKMEEEELEGNLKADALEVLLELSNEDEAFVLGFTYGLIASKHLYAKKRITQEKNRRVHEIAQADYKSAMEKHKDFFDEIEKARDEVEKEMTGQGGGEDEAQP